MENELLELKALRKQRALEQFLSQDRDIINPNDLAVLIGHEVECSATGDIDFNSAKGALDRVKQTRPYLFYSARADRDFDMRGVPQQRQKTDSELAGELFGSGSNGAAANRLAQSNIAEYRRLREIAIKMQLIA